MGLLKPVVQPHGKRTRNMKKVVFRFNVERPVAAAPVISNLTSNEAGVVHRRPSQLESNLLLQDKFYGIDWRPHRVCGKGIMLFVFYPSITSLSIHR